MNNTYTHDGVGTFLSTGRPLKAGKHVMVRNINYEVIRPAEAHSAVTGHMYLVKQA